MAVVAQDGDNYLGIFTEDVTRENMGRYSLREPRGVIITRVAEETPASRAGLKLGDVILRFALKQLTRSPERQHPSHVPSRG